MSNQFITAIRGFEGCSSALLNYLPHAIGLKNSDSVLVGVNKMLAELLGFNNPYEAIGVRDEEIKCEAAQFHEKFVKQDLETIICKKTTNLDLCKYSDGQYHAFLSTKTLINKDKNNYILFSMVELPIRNIARIFGQFRHISDLTLEKLSSSYAIKELDQSIENNIELSRRQGDCLFYLLHGMSNKEIAIKLKVSIRTVESHLERLKQILDCHTKTQLIEKGFHMGLGQIIPPSMFAMA